jgi:hypothetical protein
MCTYNALELKRIASYDWQEHAPDGVAAPNLTSSGSALATFEFSHDVRQNGSGNSGFFPQTEFRNLCNRTTGLSGSLGFWQCAVQHLSIDGCGVEAQRGKKAARAVRTPLWQ